MEPAPVNQVPPPSIPTLFATALQHHQGGRLAEAEQVYRTILEIDPRHADSLHFLGVVAHQRQHLEAAAELIGNAIALNGRAPVFHNNLGNVLQAQGKSREAAAAYGRALRLKPDYPAAHFNLGISLQAQDKLAEAADSYSRAIACRPDFADAHGNLGNVQQARGFLEEAVASYRRALRYRPEYPEAHGNLGNVLRSQGRFDEAMAAYQSAIRFRPGYAEARNNLAMLLLESDRLEDAEAACRAALECRPEYADAYRNLGNILRERGCMAEALAAYERASCLAPNSPEARLGLATGVIPIYVADVDASARAIIDFERSLDDLEAWNATHEGVLGRAVGAYQPFYLAYRPDDVTAALSRYGDLVCTAAAAAWRPARISRRSPRGPTDRLRLLVVSGQVRCHPVWDVILRGMLEHLDRGRVEVLMYHTQSIRDEQTHWAAAHVDQFVQGPKPTAAWQSEIVRAGPDVVFYPELGMDPAACALATLRLAPRQVASWGHPVTTGLPTIDQFFSGELLEGPGADAHYREQLVRLPGTGVCIDRRPVGSEQWNGPERRAGVVRFALCQQPIKFDPRDDGLLSQIARAVGPSEFWLVAPQRHDWATIRLRDRLAVLFRAEGLDPDQYLRVAPWMSRQEFDGFLDAMDVYLDCPAFSGYTTAWQAARRGLPIVTLEGRFLRHRLAAGLLRQLGTTGGIAASRERYTAIAATWAHETHHPVRRDERRVALREAALRAADNREAVHAFERRLLDA